jgi:hypothetical protein
MILTDGTNTFTTDNEDIDEKPIVNSNTSITIGGNVKSQADSRRLPWESTLYLSRTYLIDLNKILDNFDAELTYTPTRVLYGKSDIEKMVVTVGTPQIRSKVSDDTTPGATLTEIHYIVKIQMNEVIYSNA